MNLAERIALKSFGIAVAASALAASAWSADAGVAVLAGGLLAVANFRLFSKGLSKFLSPDIDPFLGKSAALASFAVRYSITGAVLYLAVKSGMSPVFFTAGLSSVVAALFLSRGDYKRAVQ